MERGDRARLWDEVRIDGVKLKEVFPRMFSLASNKIGRVEDYEVWTDSRWRWNISLRRLCFNWELEQWESFMNSLDSIKIKGTILDTIGWSFCSDGQFSV